MATSVRTASARMSAPVRMRLLEAAAQLLAESGPESVTTRKVAQAAETSTMAVYTHFGSIGELVRGVVEEGFDRLAERFALLPATEDPVADLARLSVAYLRHAQDNPSLYRVMFGGAALGQFRPVTPEDLQTGRTDTLDVVMAACERAMQAGRFEKSRPFPLVNQWWSAIHGYTMLELAGYIRAEQGRAKVLGPLLTSLFVGFGDRPETAGPAVTKALKKSLT